MARQTFRLAACVAYWLAIWVHCQICSGQDGAELTIESATPPKTVVLKDGGVLAGEVSRDGDRYVVARAGGEIQVAAENVLFVCDSLEKAYELRRAKIERLDAATHLLLADWCLSNDLLSQAARELRDAREVDPLHARLALLERRLASMRKPRSQSRRPANSTVANAATVKTTNDPSKVTTRIDELPDGAVERFTRKVQPILVNNCTTSGCHQPGGAQEFQLDRSLLKGIGNRRTTMQNLAATLALIDRRQPHLSPLLTVPRDTHGGMDRPIFGPRQQSAFTHIVDWVALVSNSQAAGDEATSADREMRVAAYNQAAIATVAKTNLSDSEKEPPTLEVEDAETSGPRVRYGAPIQFWQPKDSFDPEIFNRSRRTLLEKDEALQPHEANARNRSE